MRRIVLALSIGVLVGVAAYGAERALLGPDGPLCVYFTPVGLVEAPCR